VPFIRQTRDKRGFEQTTVLHAYHGGGSGHGRPRVLYLFRSPANLKVGRKALDAEVMEALEHTHPDLSFDWTAVSREVIAPRRPEPERQPKRPQPRPDDRSGRPGGPDIIVPADDPSLLGRTLGPAEAARLRQRFGELVQRIGRRVVTPEDRERLLDRARRLNPDDWLDEAAIRAGQGTFDAVWGQIAAELPSRRRGRRGGRRHEGSRTPSAIMDTRTEDGEGSHEQSADPGPPDGGDVAGGGSGYGSSADGAAETESPDPADDSIDD
jgi:hypothetical protein